MNSITLTEMLREMDIKNPDGKPNTFDIEFYTYSRATKKGGEKIVLKKAIKTGLKFNMKEKQMIGLKVPHSGHHIIPAHIRLITKFNNQNVIL